MNQNKNTKIVFQISFFNVFLEVINICYVFNAKGTTSLPLGPKQEIKNGPYFLHYKF